jgi:fibronectin-binding autotransporter adhesin
MNTTVTLDASPWTIGSLFFGSPDKNWIVSGGTLDGCTNMAVSRNTATVNSTLAGTKMIKRGTGTLYIGGNTNTASDIMIVEGGTLEFIGSSVTTATNLYIGNNAVNQDGGTLNIKDTAALGVTNSFLLGNPGGVSGTINQSGGTVTFSGAIDDFRIAHWPSETCSYVLSGGTLNLVAGGRIGWDGTGIMTVTGGTFNAGTVQVGRNNAVSTLNLNAGTANINSIWVSPGSYSGNRCNISGTTIVDVVNFHIGQVTGSSGIADQSGGTVTVSGNVRVGHYPNETSTYMMSGGSLILTGIPIVNPFTGGVNEQNSTLYLGIDGTGEFLQSGGSISAAALVLDNRGNTAGTDIYRLTGGSFTIGPWGIQGNVSTEIDLGGGTIGASDSWSCTLPIFLTGTNGNVTFNTGNNTITLSGILSGTGGLTKAGTGILNLNATNTYSGATTVSNGTLVLGAAASVSNTTSLFVGNGAVFDARAAGIFSMPAGSKLGGYGTVSGEVVMAAGAILSPGETNAAGVLTISSNLNVSAGMVYNWQYNAITGTGDLVRVAGDLFLPSMATVNVTRTTSEMPGRVTLFSYNGSCTPANLAKWVVNGTSGEIRNDTNRHEVVLVSGLIVLVR